MTRSISRPAFTLIGLLLVVMAVMAILVAIAVPAINSAREMARKTQCRDRLKQTGVSSRTVHDHRLLAQPKTHRDRRVPVVRRSSAATKSRTEWHSVLQNARKKTTNRQLVERQAMLVTNGSQKEVQRDRI